MWLLRDKGSSGGMQISGSASGSCAERCQNIRSVCAPEKVFQSYQYGSARYDDDYSKCEAEYKRCMINCGGTGNERSIEQQGSDAASLMMFNMMMEAWKDNKKDKKE